MARYTLLSYQLFFLLILFQAFSLIESAPMQYIKGEFHISTEKKIKYTFDLVSSDAYDVPSPIFYNATNTTEIRVTGPPGEIALYVRRTRVSWDNRTIYTDPFIHQPRMRGTIGILFSCIFTLFLCVWTAFHTNIVPERENKKKGLPGHLSSLFCGNWRRKALWSMIIIIFPESSLFFALFERMKAKEICRSIDKVLKEPLADAPNGSPEDAPNESPEDIPNESPEDVPNGSPEDASNESPEDAPNESPEDIPNGSPEDVPNGSLEDVPNGPSKKISDGSLVRTSKRFCGFLSKWTNKTFDWLRGESDPTTECWSEKQQLGYFTLMGGFAVRDTRKDETKLMTLTPCGVYFVCQDLESANKLARIVDDKNRTSALAKCLVVFQVIWIIIQIICRYSAHFSVTLLETHTVIHGVCALMTYLIWFKKPFDVKHPIELDTKIAEKVLKQDTLETERRVSRERICISQKLHPKQECMPLLTKRAGQTKLVFNLLAGKRGQSLSPLGEEGELLSGDEESQTSSQLDEKTQTSSLRKKAKKFLSYPDYMLEVYRHLFLVSSEFLIMLLASTIYGGFHAWAYGAGHFPTSMEKFLWLLALYSIAAGLGGCLLALFSSFYFAKASSHATKHRGSPFSIIKWLFAIICVIGLSAGVAARLYFFSESFAALRDPSAKSFRIVSWTNISFI